MVRSRIGWMIVSCVLVVSLALLSGQMARAEGLPEDPSADVEKVNNDPDVVAAMELLKSGNIDGAIEKLEAAAKKNPTIPPAEVVLASLFAKSKDGRGFRVWIEKAVDKHPKDPEAYVIMAQVAAAEQRITEARLLADKIKTLLDDFQGDAKRKAAFESALHELLAGLATRDKDWEKAKSHLQALLTLQPANNAKILQRLAGVLFQQGKVDEALEKLRAAKIANEKMLTPEAQVALWYESAGDHPKAIEMFTKALTVAPKDIQTRLVAAEWALKIDDLDTARQQAEAALKEDPKSLAANLMMGTVALFQHDYPAAEKHFQAAMAIQPSNFSASNNLALVYCAQDDKAKWQLAKQYAEMNARLFEKTRYAPEAFSTFGRVLFKLGNVGDAEKAFIQSARMAGAFSPDTAYYYAELLAEAGKKDEAKKLLQSSLKTKAPFSERANAEALLQRLSQ